MRRGRVGLVAVALLAGAMWPARAALLLQEGGPAAGFAVTEAMIPMRDGVKLHTRVFVPEKSGRPLPIILSRTPYGIAHAERDFVTALKTLADDGYIFAFQDIRGKYGSEGQFVMQRPARTPGDTQTLDEGTDTYDTIEWLLANVPGHNGRVGMMGVSYDGWTTIMGALEPHPALRAISPQASPADMWLGDDFHHNGAFRLSYAFEYAYMVDGGKESQHFPFDRYDTYDFYLALGPLSNANARCLHGRIPTWNDYVAHPDYDEFWRRQTVIPHIRSVTVPTLNVAGWWDQEDFYGPLAIYEALEAHDSAGLSRLVVGPWNHGGWNAVSGDRLGAIPFDQATSKYFRDEIQAPFFAYYLKDEGRLGLPEALTFEAGSNRWRSWKAWPPRADAEERSLYFDEGNTLSFTKPKAPDPAFDAYLSDPAHPVPYRHRPIQATYFPGGSTWSTWLVEDQRFVDDRPDVLSFESPPLEDDLSIAGEVMAHLYASTTGSDADWVVKLIDVHPESNPEDWTLAGYQLMVSSEVFRGRYRNGFETPEPIPSGEVQPYSFSLHTQSYTFRKGHRLMVQVQSSWFPLIDRNPQTFVPSIFEAKPEDFRTATQRIHRSARYPSHLTLPVVARGSADRPSDRPPME
jgi:putative CocE/NonD family hydrolase